MTKYILDGHWGCETETKEYDNVRDAKCDLLEYYADVIYDDDNDTGYHDMLVNHFIAEDSMSAWVHRKDEDYSWEIKVTD